MWLAIPAAISAGYWLKSMFTDDPPAPQQNTPQNDEELQQLRNTIRRHEQTMNQSQLSYQSSLRQRDSRVQQLTKQISSSRIQTNRISQQNIKTRGQMDLLTKNLTNLQMTLNKVTQELNYYKQLAKKQGDPKTFRAAKDKIFVSFLDNLKTYNFTDAIQKKKGHRYHMVMGMISAGKSSLLKKVTGVKLKTGQGQTTPQATVIGAYQNEDQIVEIFDSPGINEDFSCYDIKTLALLYTIDQIFIVYRDSLKNVNELLRIIATIKPKQQIILIRTHCDLFTSEDQLSCEEQIQVDYRYMKGLGIPCKIYAFSSKKDMNFMDNRKVSALIKRDQ